MIAIVCKPLGVKLTRTGCGERYEANNGGAAQYPKSSTAPARVTCSACRLCTVGKAHANGDRPTAWPDGTPIEVVEIEAKVGTEKIPPSTLRVPNGPPPPQRETPTDFVPKTAPASRPGTLGYQKPGSLPHRIVDVNGTKRTVAEWARETGIGLNVVRERLRTGWDVVDAVTLPKHRRPTTTEDAPKATREPKTLPPSAPAPEVDDDAEDMRAIADRLPPMLPPASASSPREGFGIGAPLQRVRAMLPAEKEAVDRAREESAARVEKRDPLAPLFEIAKAKLTPRRVLELAGFEVVESGNVPAGIMLVVRGAP